MKRFKIEVSDGEHYEIEARGFADATAAMLCEPGKYPMDRAKRLVVGIEGPKGTARFYVKRENSRNLWPISAQAAAVETHCCG